MWTIDFVHGIRWFGDNPCRKYKENHGKFDKKLTKNARNHIVYAQAIFFARTNLAKENFAHKFETSVQGFNLYMINGWAPGGVFMAQGLEKRKNQKTSKADPRISIKSQLLRLVFCLRDL